MKMSNLKIRTQLILGFGALVLFVIALGFNSYHQSNQIHLQTETMYNHPLQVRRGIGHLTANIYKIRVNMKNLFLTPHKTDQDASLISLDVLDDITFNLIENLRDRYLGPVADIDSLEYEFVKWKSIRSETITLLLAEKTQEAVSRSIMTGISGQQAEVVLRKLENISLFATAKGDDLYIKSIQLKKELSFQLTIVIVLIVLFSILIIILILNSIRKPLTQLTEATRKFQEGDLNARYENTSRNEFGELSDSFNKLTESIQLNLELNEKAANLAGLMLTEDNARKFFQVTLSALCSHTGSQIAAVYLLGEDNKTYKHFESIGGSDQSKQSFSIDNLEGEFGLTLSTKKIQHIKNINQDTRFVFNTVSNKFIPREIITIPILANKEIIAIISLASIHNYTAPALDLVNDIVSTLSARTEGILAYKQIQEFSEKLETQNTELESQKRELSAQSLELTVQNAELEVQKIELAKSSQLKTNFLSNMSHELRTPLNSVIALSGVLNRRLINEIPEEEYSYLEVIERNGKHLLSLINDILDISRIESGQVEVDITRFDINHLVRELVTMIKPQADEKSIQIHQNNGDEKIVISSDENKCRHVLQNLIANAVKFTEKGSVEIKTIQKEGGIEISVKDTGIGIGETDQQHIFDEFRQADGSTSRKFGGTGLGLSIAQKYAQLLGGIVSLTSTLDIGSEFTLSLPLLNESEMSNSGIESNAPFKQAKQQVHPISRSKISGKTILLVDDSEPALIQMKDILEGIGYQTKAAKNGAEALQVIENIIPDAMILDLMMPEIDGFELLKNLRELEKTAHIPVLILTAKHITKEDLKFLTRNNIHQLIQKGDVNHDELLNAVNSMITQGKVQNENPKGPRERQKIKGKPKVLLIEDNADNMTTLKAILDNNYSVFEATNATVGIELANKHKPHLILMDISLPGMDGIEAFKTIRGNSELEHIPVVAVTASAMSSDKATILAEGLDGYITKPIVEKVFFETINSLLYGK